MKGKSVTFRPKNEHRLRLEKLAEATERPLTWLIEKAIEAHLPDLERKYAEDLARLDASSKKGPGDGLLNIVKRHYPIAKKIDPPK